MKTEHELFLMRQENIYWAKSAIDKRWYRKLFGGDWKFIKVGKDTPAIGMFCTWTNIPLEWWDGHKVVIKEESYPYTGVDTKWKLIKEFFKQKLKKRK